MPRRRREGEKERKRRKREEERTEEKGVEVKGSKRRSSFLRIPQNCYKGHWLRGKSDSCSGTPRAFQVHRMLTLLGHLEEEKSGEGGRRREEGG